MSIHWNDCLGCDFRYEEKDTNYRTCKHPDYDEEEDVCLGYYSEEDARAESKMDEYRDMLDMKGELCQNYS